MMVRMVNLNHEEGRQVAPNDERDGANRHTIQSITISNLRTVAWHSLLKKYW